MLDWLDGGTFVSSINQMLQRTEFFVPQSGKRMPSGWDSPDEARFGQNSGGLVAPALDQQLSDWWLVNKRGANIPNWDLACQALHQGNRPALVLVEAKAYVREFTDEGKGHGSQNEQNAARITSAIQEAATDLSRHAPGVKISADAWYQFSNRIAWAWKLASLGTPTALVYLGFTGDKGIAPDYLKDDAHWKDVVISSTQHIFPASLWDCPLDANGTPLWVLLRSRACARQSHPSPR
ncbi:hypothetical protein ACRQ5Q_39370 [Bradyrhizobium sp. PMVTL-01]|uniref:hypothetical protein n=1 Tax=Bradyrhizobium sp. PMVTL-01 TaxID=3434999 RepID=UPI003F718176